MSNILLIINFNNNFTKYIHPIMIFVSRTSLILGILQYIRNILQKNEKFDETDNIKLYFDNIEISWYLPIGVLFDIAKCKYLNLICEKTKYTNIFDAPIDNDNTKFIIQQRLKHGLGMILNSLKFFMELKVQEVENYIAYVLSIKSNDELQNNFYDLIEKIYAINNIKKYNVIRIPIALHIKHKTIFYMSELSEDELNNNTLKDIIWKSGISNEILQNKENMIINGITFEGWKNIPILWAIKNMCYCDLFLHIIFYL